MQGLLDANNRRLIVHFMFPPYVSSATYHSSEQDIASWGTASQALEVSVLIMFCNHTSIVSAPTVDTPQRQVGRGNGSSSRREAGISDFIRRALQPVMPDREDFGFTVRLNADALGLDGSAAAASVCRCACLGIMELFFSKS